MLDCRNVHTPRDAEEFLDAQLDRLDRVWKSIPKDDTGRACEPGFGEYRAACDEYDAAKRYLIKRGLIWEEQEDIYAG